MREWFDKLEKLLSPTHKISAGEDVIDTLVFFAIMLLLLLSVM